MRTAEELAVKSRSRQSRTGAKNLHVDVVTLGEALIGLDSRRGRLDAVHTLDKSVGGAEANTVIGLARLGHRTAYMGRVGEDPLGREVERTLRGEGVDVTRLVQDDERPTALMLKERRGPADVAVHYYRGGCAGSALDVGDVDRDLIAEARLLHVTGVTLALGERPRKAVVAAAEAAREAGVLVSLDANFRYKLGTVAELVEQFEAVAPLADHVLMSWSEVAACAGSDEEVDVLRYAASLRRAVTVVKGRGGGARAVVDGEVVASVPVEPVDVVDPVGAGDGFAVGYLHGLLEGAPVDQRLRVGAWIAGRAVAHHGDYEGLPLAAELADWISPAPAPRRGMTR